MGDHVCQFCGKDDFRSSSALRIHVVQSHTDEYEAEIRRKLTDELRGSLGTVIDEVVAERLKAPPAGGAGDIDAAEIQRQVETNVAGKLEAIVTGMQEFVQKEVAGAAQSLADQAQAAITERMGGGQPNAGQGAPAPAGADMKQMFMEFLMRQMAGGGGGGSGGGGDFMSQASHIGSALGAMLAPIATIQGQAFSQALQMVNLASRLPAMTPDQIQKGVSDIMSPPAPGGGPTNAT